MITTLANGMQVVVVSDRRSPIVTHMIRYRNGSSADPLGKSGIAHVLEHLMFEGTRTYPPGHFTGLPAAVGGTENAATTHDVTVYYQRVPAAYLATCMAYADRGEGGVRARRDPFGPGIWWSGFAPRRPGSSDHASQMAS